MWKKVRLGDICENLDAKRVPITKAKRVPGKVPYYGASGIVDYVEGYIFNENLLLVSEDGANLLARTYPIAFSISGKTWVNNHAHVLRFKDECTRRFIEYYLNSISLSKFVSGMAQPKLNQKMLVSIPVSLPPLAEQQRIVAKLDAAFAEIDGAIEAVKSQIEYSKDFLDSTIEELFNNKEYAEHRMDDICTFVGGSQPPKSVFEYEKSENNIRLIQIRDYKSDKHIVYIPKDMARRFCNQSDVMIGRYGPPIFQILRGISGSYNVALMKAIPKENILNDYLFYFLKNKKIQNFVINKSTRAAGQSGVNKAALEPYIIHLPPLDIQKFILNKCEKIQNQKIQLSNTYKTKLENLISLKSSILAQELQSEAA